QSLSHVVLVTRLVGHPGVIAPADLSRALRGLPCLLDADHVLPVGVGDTQLVQKSAGLRGGFLSGPSDEAPATPPVDQVVGSASIPAFQQSLVAVLLRVSEDLQDLLAGASLESTSSGVRDGRGGSLRAVVEQPLVDRPGDAQLIGGGQ